MSALRALSLFIGLRPNHVTTNSQSETALTVLDGTAAGNTEQRPGEGGEAVILPHSAQSHTIDAN